MASPDFQAACQAALLHYTERLDMNDGKSILMLRGAKEFLTELLNIGNSNKPAFNIAEDQLDPV